MAYTVPVIPPISIAYAPLIVARCIFVSVCLGPSRPYSFTYGQNRLGVACVFPIQPHSVLMIRYRTHRDRCHDYRGAGRGTAWRVKLLDLSEILLSNLSVRSLLRA